MSIKRELNKKKKEKERKKKKTQALTSKTISSHYRAAEWSHITGDKKRTVFHLKKILQIKPDSKDALVWMAEMQFNSKNYAESKLHLQRLKDLGDKWIFLEFYLGLSYYYSNNSNTSMILAMENLKEFVSKTSQKKRADILKKRAIALDFINIIGRTSRLAQEPLAKPIAKTPVDEKKKEELKAKPLKGAINEESMVEDPAPSLKQPPLIDINEYNYNIDIKYSFSQPAPILSRIKENRTEDTSIYNTRLEYYHLSLLRGYDELLCLDTLKNVDHYWYQIETVKHVLKYFRGRILLADEVGLGKTIEACMLIKEYLMRGLIKRVLILTPTSLVSQWHEELSNKFGLSFATTDHEDFRQNKSFWMDHPMIIASINIAKSKKNFEQITHIEHDLVVVDEAHHMRNRSTLNWKLVNTLKKRFIFLISATPVQNNLIELFNLITLLKPGFLKTEREFRKKYIASGKPKMPKNSETLRQLLREVMIRNTRSLIDVKLPPRYATTIMIESLPLERQIYNQISSLVRQGYKDESLDRFSLTNLQMRAGSSFFSLEELLIKIRERNHSLNEQIAKILSLLSELKYSEKENMLMELIRKKPGDKKIIFTHYRKTLEYLADFLRKEGICFTQFSGDMSNALKDKAIDDFREHGEVLLSTEVGGEGRNIQFCRTIINYDLPWNPMRIEQRIGRIHRIGQTNDVFIFNFCLKGSVEEYILNILDKKINMFELVIGEIDNILGNLDEETEFSDLVMDIWINSNSMEEAEQEFNKLADKMIEAKKEYLESKELDEALLATDFEV